MSRRKRLVSIVTVILLVSLLGSAASAAVYGSRPLRSGVTGSDVGELQRILTFLGHSVAAITDVFDESTEQAVIAFQKRQGLTPDGVVGPVTFKALSAAQQKAIEGKGTFPYKVLPGDTLWLMAARFGTTVEALRQLNNLSGNLIYPGQELMIPGPAPNPAPAPEPGPKPNPNPNPGPSPAPSPSPSPSPGSGSDKDSGSGKTGTVKRLPFRFSDRLGRTRPAPAPNPDPSPAPDPNPNPDPSPTPSPEPVKRARLPFRFADRLRPKPPAPVPSPDPAPTPQPNPDPQPQPQPTPQPNPTPNPTPDPKPNRPGKFLVFGYYAEDWYGDWKALEAVLDHAASVDGVIAFQYAVDASGILTGPGFERLLSEARSRNIPVYALVHNFTPAGFDRDVAHKVIADVPTRTATVENILKVLKDNGMAGVNIDIENVNPGERQAYTDFVRALVDRLRPEGLKVTLSIPAKTVDRLNDGWSGGFDYPALGRLADYIMPMAYDEHWFGGEPGPVASIGWVEAVVKYAVSVIPADKVVLGVPAYGYDWPENGGAGYPVTAAKAIANAGATGARVQWDEQAKVPYYRYTKNGVNRVVYYEDSSSLGYKLDLVVKYGIGGIALWRLGFEDPEMWTVIEQKLK